MCGCVCMRETKVHLPVAERQMGTGDSARATKGKWEEKKYKKSKFFFNDMQNKVLSLSKKTTFFGKLCPQTLDWSHTEIRCELAYQQVVSKQSANMLALD